MWLLILNVMVALCELCVANVADSAETSFELLTTATKNEPECSFDNIGKVIGHNDFSVLGKTSSCTIFYVIGDEIDGKHFDLAMVTGKRAGCNDPVPLFYRQDDEYKVLVAQKKSVYLRGCDWQESDTFHICQFSRSDWKKTWVIPEGEVDEIVGHVTDINADILHVLYKDEEAVMFDSMYNLSSGTFAMNKKMRDANFKISSFDSDLMRLYYEADKLGYEEVESDRGVFIYKSGHRQLLHFNESDYTAFSFSNKFYLVKKKYRTNRELYFVGNEDSAEQLCVSNTASGDALILQLFVGDNDSSVHAKIRAQISPKKTTTAMVASTPTTNSANTITTSTFLFSLLACFFTAR